MFYVVRAIRGEVPSSLGPFMDAEELRTEMEDGYGPQWVEAIIAETHLDGTVSFHNAADFIDGELEL